MEFHAKMEVPSGRKLEVENAEKRETYFRMGDYILGTRLLDFYNVGVKEPRIPTDHRMVLGKIIGEGVRRHCWYCKEQDTWTILQQRREVRDRRGIHTSMT